MKRKDPWDDFVIQNGRRVPREHAEIAKQLELAWKSDPDYVVDLTSRGFTLTERDEIAELNASRLARAHAARNELEKTNAAFAQYSVRIDLKIAEQEESDPRTTIVGKVESSFRLVDLLVPKRLSNEEIGDAVECINRMLMDPAYKPWKIWLKVATTWIWIAVNAVRNVASALTGKRAE